MDQRLVAAAIDQVASLQVQRDHALATPAAMLSRVIALELACEQHPDEEAEVQAVSKTFETAVAEVTKGINSKSTQAQCYNAGLELQRLGLPAALVGELITEAQAKAPAAPVPA